MRIGRKLAAIMIALRKKGVIRPSVRKGTNFWYQGDAVNKGHYTFGRMSHKEYPGFDKTGFPDLGSHYQDNLETRINFLSPSGAPVSFDKHTRTVPTRHSRLRLDKPQGATGFQVNGPAKEVSYLTAGGERIFSARRLGAAIGVKPSMLLNKEKVADQVVREFEHGLGKSPGLNTPDFPIEPVKRLIREHVIKDMTERRRNVAIKVGAAVTGVGGSALGYQQYRKRKTKRTPA